MSPISWDSPLPEMTLPGQAVAAKVKFPYIALSPTNFYLDPAIEHMASHVRTLEMQR